MKKSFLLHIDSLGVIDDLTDEQAGLLFRAIKSYQNNEDLKLDGVVKIAFSPFKNQFIRDDEKYKITCDRRREAGSKGGKQKVANASKSKQKVANLADSKNKNKNKSDNDKEEQENICFNHNDIVLLFHAELSGLPKILKLSDKRKASVKKLIATDLPDKDNWTMFFRKINESDFLMGRSTDFKCSFDWIIKPANVLKISEGNYDNKEAEKEDEIFFDDESNSLHESMMREMAIQSTCNKVIEFKG